MKTAAILALTLSVSTGAASAQSLTGSLTGEDVRAVSPALEAYVGDALASLWARPGLSGRDRSVVTLSAVIAGNQATLLPDQVRLALDNGVTPAEVSEIITHLAFYAGWGNALAATTVAGEVFSERGVGADQLPAAAPSLLPLDEEAEATRVAQVNELVGSAAPGLVQDTTDVLFNDLWLRPDLAPRDRSLVTVSALIANGQAEQVPGHLNRAMDNGLTQEEAGEAISHLAYYAGWPNAFSAASIAREVFEQRGAD